MLAQIGEWIELNFWQLAVHALSKARPLSWRASDAVRNVYAAHGVNAQPGIATQHSFEARPLLRAIGSFAASPYAIAAGGWLLGLILGLWFSSW